MGYRKMSDLLGWRHKVLEAVARGEVRPTFAAIGKWDNRDKRMVSYYMKRLREEHNLPWPPNPIEIARVKSMDASPPPPEASSPERDLSLQATREYLAKVRDDPTIAHDARIKAALGLMRGGDDSGETATLELDDPTWASMLIDAALALGRDAALVVGDSIRERVEVGDPRVIPPPPPKR